MEASGRSPASTRWGSTKRAARMTTMKARFPPSGAGVELRDEGGCPTSDFVTDAPDLLECHARRVLQVPVDVAPARDVRALVPAAHRDHQVGLLCALAR